MVTRASCVLSNVVASISELHAHVVPLSHSSASASLMAWCLATYATVDLPALALNSSQTGGADISCALIRDEYEVQKFSWVDLLCFEKNNATPIFYTDQCSICCFSQWLPSHCCFSKMPVNPSTCPPYCPPLAQKKKIREKLAKKAQIFTFS